MSIVYDLAYLTAAVIFLPVAVLKRKIHAGFLMRLGFLPKAVTLKKPIWIHAVSVGEAMAVRHFIEQLRSALPQQRFVISTVTATGNRIAKTLARPGDAVIYLPLDISFIVRHVIERLDPALFIAVETEIWPNLISYLNHKRIPIAVINGRISDRSFRGYTRIRFLIKPVLQKISLFCVQTERDARRLLSLGVEAAKIRISGNMKFDSEKAPSSVKEEAQYRMKLSLGSDEKLFVAGSTHAGEEEIVLEAYRRLRNEFTQVRLLVAPRHPERAGEVADLVKKCGLQPVRISQMGEALPYTKESRCVFILDTVGELVFFYRIADIVFVGGSLVRKGGHNILEPAALGKPVLFGPHMFNFRDIADLFLSNNAAELVRTREELEYRIRYLLHNTVEASVLGERAKAVVFDNRGATTRTREFVLNMIVDSEVLQRKKGAEHGQG